MVESPIQVAVAIMRDEQGRILISRRQAGTHLAGLWEFPGGKLEPGETTGNALRREIREELGVEIIRHRPLIRISHSYEEKTVLLDTHLVLEWRGEAAGLEGQQIEWASEEELLNYPLPEADKPLLKALALPESYLVTPPRYRSRAEFLGSLERALESGIQLLQLRLPGMPDEELFTVAERVRDLCDRYGASLMVKNRELAETLDCGLHMTAEALLKSDRRPMPAGNLVAASCHCEVEVNKAQALDLDFITLSPVRPTASHDDAIPLGWKRFGELVEKTVIPVYALGGLSEDDLPDSWAVGGQGIAAIRSLWPEYP